MTPPVPAIARTRIRHLRSTPVRHGFDHRSATWLIDIDDLPRVPRGLRWCADFRPADHFPESPRAGDTLRARLERHLTQAGVPMPDGQILALTSPRVAGYVFNPLSVFWCHHRDGSPGIAIAEVHNTYGERHVYVVDLDSDGNAQVPKEFYVSPFNDVDGRYRLHLPPPRDDGTIDLSITLDRSGQEPFVATLTGRATPATPRTVFATQLRAPLAPLIVTLRIRLHGIRLWLRRLPVVARPDHPDTTTIATHVRSEK